MMFIKFLFSFDSFFRPSQYARASNDPAGARHLKGEGILQQPFPCPIGFDHERHFCFIDNFTFLSPSTMVPGMNHLDLFPDEFSREYGRCHGIMKWM